MQLHANICLTGRTDSVSLNIIVLITDTCQMYESLILICVLVQIWCILTDTGEVDLVDRSHSASHTLTVCTYPEVSTAGVYTVIIWCITVLIYLSYNCERSLFLDQTAFSIKESHCNSY